MHVTITSDLVPFVDQLIADGNFSTPDAAICDALKQLRDRQTWFDDLKASMDEAVAEYERGEAKPLDFAEIKRKAREMVAARGQP
jgi:Arc/MetJ-type ribon-helix-helix transcriptional regulator